MSFQVINTYKKKTLSGYTSAHSYAELMEGPVHAIRALELNDTSEGLTN